MFAKLKSWAILFNYENGGFSHTKFWSNAGYATGTFAILHLLFTHVLTPEYLGLYLSCTALHATASKYLNMKGADQNTEQPSP